MNRASLLDTGVVLGYCFTVDSHHVPCKQYLERDSFEFYVTPTIEEEYDRAKHKLNTRYSEAILDHLSDLESSDFEGQLDPFDFDQIKKQMLAQNDEAYDILYRFYDDIVPQICAVDEVEYQLRELARDIEQMANRRKHEIDSLVRLWVTEEGYREVRESLSEIHEPDLTICIEGHDLAVHMDVNTELATCNPSDYVKEGRKSLILDNTDLDDVNCLI